MKKTVILLIGTFLFLSSVHGQQNKNTSLTISVAPAYFGTLDEKFDPETFYRTSLYATINFIIKERLSFSTGLHLLSKKTVEFFDIDSFLPGYSGPVHTTNRITLFDIPIQLNYHIIKPNNKINLYAKTELKNSVIANYTKGEPDMSGKYVSETGYGYNMFFGLGFGIDFIVVDRLSFVLEPGLNYSVAGQLPDVGLIDCKFGLKYGLFRK